MNSIRILLVDDHHLVRQCYKQLLNDHPLLEVVGEASDGEEAIHLASILKPDLVVLDYNMPTLNGVKTTQRLKKIMPHLPVIGLTVYAKSDLETKDVPSSMRQAGAAECVIKDGSFDHLYVAILKEMARYYAESTLSFLPSETPS